MTKRQGLLLSCLSFLLFVLCVFCAFSLYFPTYLETKLIPRNARKAGFTDFDCDVRNVGLYNLDLGKLSVSGEGRNIIEIGSVRLDYTPIGLFKRHIDTIMIDGARLHIALEGGKIVIPGLALPDFSPPPTLHAQRKSFSRLHLPVSIGAIRIHHGLLLFSTEGKTFNIPFDIQLNPAADDHSRDAEILEGTVQFFLENREMLLTANVDLTAGIASVNFSCDKFRLNDLFDLAGVTLPPQLNTLLNAHMDAVIKITQDGLESTGSMGMSLKGTKKSIQSIPQPITLSADFKASYADSSEWHVEIENEKTKQQDASTATITMRYGDLDIVSQRPQIVLSGKGRKQMGDMDFTMRLPAFRLSSEAGILYAPLLTLKGNVEFGTRMPDEKNLTALFDFMAKKLEFNSKERGVAAHGDFSFAGKVYFDQQQKPGLTGLVSLSKADVSHETLQLKADGIKGMIPLRWPFESNPDKGSFQVEIISRESAMFGPVTGTIWQNLSGFTIEGEHKDQLLPGLHLGFKGEANFSEKGIMAGLNFSVPRFEAESVELGKILPAAKNAVFNGELELAGGISFESEKIEGSVDTNIYNGTLIMQEHDIMIEGIRLTLPFPNLPAVHSGPAILEYKKASFGEMIFKDGRIVFKIESPQSFLLEQSGFNWCGGHVYTYAIRVTPKEQQYDITMYCDRLSLADVLEQFGITNAEGEGTVNGRIPLRYENGSLSFNDGFLYSTPGIGGTIRIASTDTLTAGLPENTPQYAQLDFAGAALKDFKYNWATVQLNTKGNDAILQLRLDGKPARPLPFVYHKELGRFTRVEAESKKGIQHPILLDVNFRLPIDEILGYAGKAKGFYRMIQ